MKSVLTAAILFLLMVLPLQAVDQVFIEPFNPVTPEVLAVGKTSTANVRGYNSLFLNPASFSIKDSEGVTVTTQVSPYVPVTSLNRILSNISAFQSFNMSNPGSSDVSLVNDIVTKYGVGEQFSLGSSYIGHGFGVGLIADERSFAKGSLLLGTSATIDMTLALCIGYSFPVDIQVGTLHLGLSARPMYKTYGVVPLTSVIGNGSNMTSIPVLSGYGLGWDMGAIAEMGEFCAGLALRDIGSTPFNMHSGTLGDTLTHFVTNMTNFSSTTSSVYRIPMTIALGGSWKPEIPLYKNIFEPQIMADLQIPLEDQFTEPSFLTWVHLGAEAKFLSFLSVRTGLNQGYFTMGMGMRILAVDINWAIYADEMGRYAGTTKRSGMTLEAALKF